MTIKEIMLLGCATFCVSADRAAAGQMEINNVVLTPLGSCTGKADRMGEIRIRFKKNLTMKYAFRASKINQNMPEEPTETPTPGSTESDITPIGGDPVHIQLDRGKFGKMGRVRVRVMIPNDSEFGFPKIDNGVNFLTQGIAQGESPSATGPVPSDPDGLLCGTKQVKYKDGMEIATFFIQLEKRKANYGPSFNIILYSSDAKDTPIIVDPKIHDTGQY